MLSGIAVLARNECSDTAYIVSNIVSNTNIININIVNISIVNIVDVVSIPYILSIVNIANKPVIFVRCTTFPAFAAHCSVVRHFVFIP